MDRIVLIDGNAIGFASSATQVLKVGEQETQAIYGFLRVLRSMMLKMPTATFIVLWDGVSWRKERFPEYKAQRDEVKNKHDAERVARRTAYKSQRKYIYDALKMLGVRQMSASNLEADDLAGMLVKKFVTLGKRVALVTGDTDWLQLVQENVSWIDPRKGDLITMKNFTEKTGVATGRQWLDVKALMGDVADNIPGVGGIGEKTAIELVNAFGSVSGFLNRVLEDRPKKMHARLGAFADNVNGGHEIFIRNTQLMDLMHPEIPQPHNLRTVRGEINASAFHDFCEELLFNSITRDLDGWVEPFRNAR